MKKIFYIAALLTCNHTYSQVNLVLNPSFEDKVNCPVGPGDIQQVIGWNTFRESPDYFNSCGSIGVKVPDNSYGYQKAATGNAYVGIICFNNSIFSREILSDSLTAPLSIGQKYFISFKVNKADDESIVGYSTNKMGAKLSTVKLTNLTINNAAHFYTNTVISDTTNWTRIRGSFIADSAYQYLMIGNFFDDSNTTSINSGTGAYAYYYIDDVCISTDSLLCANYLTFIKENDIEKETLIYPNPASNKLTVKLKTSGILKIFDNFGQCVLTKDIKVSENIDMTHLQDGLYIFSIITKDKTHYDKILIKH